ncbi:cysteine-rich receptor-like protein kinase 10 [Silene latifolia]|uniref:cysteine-rich receptor-like protein kinase 10 n=1 Tax=Silene latifolia TaxID=37657 RepID=UPI003D789FA5
MGVVLSRLWDCINNKFRHDSVSTEALDNSDLFFSFTTLQNATNFFSDLNLLGRGGFGPVYKGFIPDGREIAVKKLSVYSRQGLTEFTNEVKLLLRTQHKNLVTLLGCCIDGDEKMLVYEYLPNKSLDYFLFNKDKSVALDWAKRYRIIIGIARGLLYLHEEAPERIIHRDVKASNILLDKDLNPKISDFGLARLFPGDGTHLDTFKISGTYGYMAPEYAMHGYLSVKSDVFSFGILMLELVSGRKNFADQLGAEKADLLRYTWMLYQEGKALELVDATLAKCNPDEAAMCIQLGLLCCQATVSDRPTMSSVHLKLCSDSFTLPQPGKPGVHGRRWLGKNTTSSAFTNTNPSSSKTTVTGSSVLEEFSVNSISVSSLEEGR